MQRWPPPAPCNGVTSQATDECMSAPVDQTEITHLNTLSYVAEASNEANAAANSPRTLHGRALLSARTYRATDIASHQPESGRLWLDSAPAPPVTSRASLI